MDYKKALPLLDRFIKWATPKRVLLLAFAAISLIIGITVFEQRSTLANILTAGHQEQAAAPQEFRAVLTPEIKDKIQTIVTRSPIINMIGVMTVNLRVNQRDMFYFYSNEPAIELEWRKYLSSRGTIQPVFTSDEKNNTQMVAVINGEFACYKFEDTNNARMLPGMAHKMPYVCRVSLPPYYGEFSGYLMLGLASAPSETEQGELRIEAVRLATDIYFKTITKRRGGL